jgi:hypothetical protein
MSGENLDMMSMLDEIDVVKPAPRREETMSLKALAFIDEETTPEKLAVAKPKDAASAARSKTTKAASERSKLLAAITSGEFRLRKTNSQNIPRSPSFGPSEKAMKTKRLMLKKSKQNRRKGKKKQRGTAYADRMEAKVSRRRGRNKSRRHSPY